MWRAEQYKFLFYSSIFLWSRNNIESCISKPVRLIRDLFTDYVQRTLGLWKCTAWTEFAVQRSLHFPREKNGHLVKQKNVEYNRTTLVTDDLEISGYGQDFQNGSFWSANISK